MSIIKFNEYKKLFKGKCPYTDTKCNDWNCTECEVNMEEEKSLKKYLEELKRC